jgi:hypothetical protein
VEHGEDIVQTSTLLHPDLDVVDARGPDAWSLTLPYVTVVAAAGPFILDAQDFDQER